MSNQERLPEDLLFQEDGHVTEVALTCLADGELTLLSEEALAHMDACDACTARLGAAALASIGAGDALLELGATTSLAAAEARAFTRMEIAMPIKERTTPIEARASSVGLLSPAVSGELAVPVPSSKSRRPFPFAAIAVALVIAIVAGAPGFLEAASTLPGLLRSVPVLVRVVLGLLRGTPDGLLNVALLLRWISAAVFIMAGFFVARTMTQKRSLQGGMG